MADGQEKRLAAADGTLLYLRDWRAAPTLRQAVLIVHGFGEHSGRYAHVIRFFQELGWAVRVMDWRGHGRSEGARGVLPNGAPLLQDAEIVLDDFSQKLGYAPLLFGHSMGGLFAAQFVLQKRSALRGLILSAPALGIPLARWQSVLARLMLRLAPDLPLPSGLQSDYLSHDAQVGKAYREDPLVHSWLSARMLAHMQAAGADCLQHAARLDCPCLLMVAGQDKLVDSSASLRWASLVQAAKPGMLTCKQYPDSYHEILQDLAAPAAFADMRAWLQAQGLLA
ncbi:lysophospholipase [Massilia sp. W12]|uniref:alpha/beta hydrolase n=1 Tax=Massilia sp. W12 TaxID=3126507 RepID=UPI0030D45188